MIRKITAEDRALYLSMAADFYTSGAVNHPVDSSNFEKTFSELMRSEEYASCYILEYEGNTAGYALLAKTFSQEAGGTVIWIEELYVLPQYRSNGIGQEFFDFLKNKFHETPKRFRLEVTEENKRAISLYERMGFEPLPYLQYLIDL